MLVNLRAPTGELQQTNTQKLLHSKKNTFTSPTISNMSNTDMPDNSPVCAEGVGGYDVEQQIYGIVLQTHEPTTASAIADTAGCPPKVARKYLAWFDNLGIVTQHTSDPATYERNDAFFEWRRSNDLAATQSLEELQERVQEATSRITEYEEQYDAASPAAVDPVSAAQASDELTSDEVRSDLDDWERARKERDRYERARKQQMADEREQLSRETTQ